MSREQMLEDLERSAIPSTQVKKLGFQVLTPEEAKELTNLTAPAYKIPYFDADGKETEFYRIRFLETHQEGGAFGAKKELPRYMQPGSTLPRLYLSPTEKWRKIAKDISADIVITEGEKKAVKACLEGIVCIGLGGVWSWQAKKRMMPKLKDFDEFEWKGRNVILCFDSDMYSNDKVMYALNAFSKMLTDLGAVVLVRFLPDVDGEKTGLDDFLISHGKKEFDKLDTEPYSRNSGFWEMNNEVAYIKEVGQFLQIETGLFMTKAKMVSDVYTHRNTWEWQGDKKTEINLAAEWAKWPHRREHLRLEYRPGEPKTLSNGAFNTWNGWGVEPVEGDVTPFLELIESIFEDSPQDAFDWFLQWLAFPIQHPGEKVFSAVAVHSPYQGTGKSFVGYIMGDIYGENFSVVDESDIHGTYNDWAVNKQFIMGEEITGSDRRKDADRIKAMLTRELVRVNKKWQPGYQVRDCAAYYLTSNHPDMMFLEQTDRRLLVIEKQGRPKPEKFYERVDKWRKNGGAAHLMHYLLHNVDCSKFNPKSAPPITSAKVEMIEMSRSDIDQFCAHMFNFPEELLPDPSRDLYTIEQIVYMYDPDESKRTSNVAMAKALRRAGLRQCQITKTKDGSKRLWICRNSDKWLFADHCDRQANYDGPTTRTASRGGSKAKVTHLKGKYQGGRS